MGKIRLSFTEADIKASRAKLEAERPDLAEKFKPKKITGNTRNAALREMLIPHFGTKVRFTKATMPKPVQPSASEGTKQEKF
jgi:hypothetical protein